MNWIDRLTQAVANAAGLDPAELELDVDAKREILDLARIASHASGERINAPLLCYSLGVAVGKGAGLMPLGAAIRAEADRPS